MIWGHGCVHDCCSLWFEVIMNSLSVKVCIYIYTPVRNKIIFMILIIYIFFHIFIWFQFDWMVLNYQPSRSTSPPNCGNVNNIYILIFLHYLFLILHPIVTFSFFSVFTSLPLCIRLSLWLWLMGISNFLCNWGRLCYIQRLYKHQHHH